MKDYLSDFLTLAEGENLKIPKEGKAQKAQNPLATFGNTQRGQGSKGSKVTFDTFDTSHSGGVQDIWPDENIEMHDSALWDVAVTFYDGRRLRIPQQSTPEGWQSPF